MQGLLMVWLGTFRLTGSACLQDQHTCVFPGLPENTGLSHVLVLPAVQLLRNAGVSGWFAHAHFIKCSQLLLDNDADVAIRA
jgi:hypothetical protein